MALRRISLRDFVIVDVLEIDFQEGFTALTGETGAGKSILIDALQLIMGARADGGVIRSGASRTDLVAEFDLNTYVLDWLEEAGFDTGESLLLRRSIEDSGKSRGWINGIPATATQLRAVGSRLVDIHGQHAWQNLMTMASARGLLDAYAGVNVAPVQNAWYEWRGNLKGLEIARNAQSTAREERDRLQWQIAELSTLAPGDDEWDLLNNEHTRMGHAQALLEAAQFAAEALDGEETGAHAVLTKAHEAIAAKQHLEPSFGSIGSLLADSLAQAGEAQRELHAYLRRDAIDAQQLHALDDRVALWISLARRFKRQPSELAEMLRGWKQDLATLEANGNLDFLEKAERAAKSSYDAAASALTRKRIEAAPSLADAVTELLQGLGMKGGVFSVVCSTSETPGPHGLEDVELLAAGHAGQEPRPIAKVASGGELSRIALAIAVTTSASGGAETLIFDEVDSGVGGVVAHTVGRLMKRLGHAHQVLAVTHLAQVAACADHHLVVTKASRGHTANSSVRPTTGTARTTEIARMLGGGKDSDASLAHAQEMLDQGNADHSSTESQKCR